MSFGAPFPQKLPVSPAHVASFSDAYLGVEHWTLSATIVASRRHKLVYSRKENYIYIYIE